MQDMDAHPTLESALNARYRGHDKRDWAEWRDRYAYEDASAILVDAANALIGRRKGSVRANAATGKHRWVGQGPCLVPAFLPRRSATSRPPRR
jgi:hypothetical protein